MTRMPPMTPARRLRWTALLFLVALISLAIASLTHDVWPLFVGWIPLLAVPWILTRPEEIPAGTPEVGAVEVGAAEVSPAEASATHDEPATDRPA
jgi:hypothetical protein